jgi:hypothetical protein
MSTALPPEVVVTETVDGVHYRLPRLQLGSMRWGGCFLILFGCVPAGMGAAFIALAVTILSGFPWPTLVLTCLILVIPLVFLLVGLSMIFFGSWFLCGHQEIELTASHVRGALRVGPLRWSGRRLRARLKQFTVVRGNQEGRNPAAPGPGWNVLQAECDGSKPLQLANGYPEEWLRALADDLTRNCRTLSAAPVRVAEESASPHDIRERRERPVNSRVVLKEQVDGVILIVPPAGVWRGSNWFIVSWTFLWMAILLPMTSVFGTVALQGAFTNAEGEPISPLCPLLFLVPFWLVGIGFLLAILHRGQRRVALAVDGTRLLVVHSGLFGSRRSEWSREEITDVCVACDRRSMIGEGKRNPYYPWQIELRVVVRDGADVNVVTYREGDPRKADLEWMATVLHLALRVGQE